jgi:Zn-dependent M32 family carboxypeptidase
MEVEKESSSSVETSKSDQLPAEEIKEEASSTDEQSRLWAAVKEKPSDFTSWTSLLQTVEQKVLLIFMISGCTHF